MKYTHLISVKIMLSEATKYIDFKCIKCKLQSWIFIAEMNGAFKDLFSDSNLGMPINVSMNLNNTWCNIFDSEYKMKELLR